MVEKTWLFFQHPRHTPRQGLIESRILQISVNMTISPSAETANFDEIGLADFIESCIFTAL
jgi:hypothetical protein